MRVPEFSPIKGQVQFLAFWITQYVLQLLTSATVARKEAQTV